MSGNYVVPGANPNIETGVQAVLGGTNINVTGTITEPIINSTYSVVSERANTANTFVITGTTQATAQNVLSITLTTDYTSNISMWGNFSLLTNTNTIRDVSYFFQTTINGQTQVVGNIFRTSFGGTGHSITCPILATIAGVASGDIAITLKIFASVASVFTIGPTQILAIGNISQD